MSGDGLGALSHETTQLQIHDGEASGAAMQPPDIDPDDPPPPPRIYSNGTVATDITDKFISSAKLLGVGQIVKDGSMTLMEAVAALEIMDPKMDSGYLEPGDTLWDEYDVARALSAEETLGVIDQLLCHEMGWHMGYPLSQTLLTSLYIEHILMPQRDSLEDMLFTSNTPEPTTLRVLRAYCIGLIKSCSHVNLRVQAEHFYEEEDFVIHTFHRTLLDHIDDEPVLEFLEATRQTLTKASNIAADLRKALDQRLQFRASFLRLVASTDARSIETLKPRWEELLSLVPGLMADHELGQPVAAAFSSKLQRKLASTAPSRPIVETSFDDAYKHLLKLCQDGLDVTQVLNYYDSHSLMNFVFLFQSRKPQPSVYIRTLLQHFLFGNMIILGSMSVRQIMDDDLENVVLPSSTLLDRGNDEIEVPHDPRFIIAQKMESFRARAAQSYLDIFRTLCQNRCRIRRTLTHTIADWDNLQSEAEALDQELREYTKEEAIVDLKLSPEPVYSYPLSSWAYFYKLQQMQWIVQMGFELDIYQEDELAAMYWYLHFLSHTKRQHLERIRGFIIRQYFASGKGKEKSDPREDPVFGRTLSFISIKMLEDTATRTLADALNCIFVVLTRLGHIHQPPRPYSDDEKRYELRMKPFLHIGLPDLLPYAQFHTAVAQPREATANLLQYAAESTAHARKDFELLLKLDASMARCHGAEESWKARVKNCVKACITASIAAMTIQKTLTGSASEAEAAAKLRVVVPPAEKCYHDWWIIPDVKAI